MMDAIQSLCALLEKKEERFARYEEHTVALETCEIDDIEEYITKRSQLAIEIDKIDAEMKTLCAALPEGGELLDAAANRCNYADAPEGARCVFERGQALYAIMNRIAAREPGIANRMQTTRGELLEKIKGAQNTPKIERYLNGLTPPPAGGQHLGTRYGKA